MERVSKVLNFITKGFQKPKEIGEVETRKTRKKEKPVSSQGGLGPNGKEIGPDGSEIY